MTQLEPGQTVDRYHIEGVLGQGGMGRVLLARHVHLGTRHALKLLLFQSPALAERLLMEGRVQASLRHPNIVPVTDVADVPGGLALVLEFVDGPPLLDWAEEFGRSGPQIDALAEGLFAGLAAAHAAGVVHRDLKPANVMLAIEADRLACKITDFGLARIIDQEVGRLTRSGQSMGTPAYMPPEQHRNAKTLDHRADIFSLGAVLYELVCGRAAFTAEDAPTLYQQASSRGYRPVAEAAPGAPARFARAIEAALSPDPADRPDTVAALRAIWRDGTPPPASAWTSAELSAIRGWWFGRNTPTATPATVDHGGASPTLPPPSPPPAVAPTSAPGAPFPIGLWIGAVGVAILFVLAIGVGAAGWWLGQRRDPVPADASAPVLTDAPAPVLTDAPAPVLTDPPAPVLTDPPVPVPAAASSAAVDASATLAAAPTARAEAPEAPVKTPIAPPTEAAEPGRAAPSREPTTAFVKLVGVGRGELVGGDGRAHGAGGAVPQGDYRLRVWFEPDVATDVMEISLSAGEVREVRCSAGVRRCR